MIKNKTKGIKIIFKTYLKILKIGQKYFSFPNKLLFYKNQRTIFKNRFQKLFFRIVFKNGYQTSPQLLTKVPYSNLEALYPISVVTRSSAEAEFKAMAQGISELLQIFIILIDLGITLKGPMKLYCDNQDAINIAHNPVHHDRTKHVEIDQHFIKEKLNNGLICTVYVPSSKQMADILTKGLPSSTFYTILDKLENISHQLEWGVLEEQAKKSVIIFSPYISDFSYHIFPFL